LRRKAETLQTTAHVKGEKERCTVLAMYNIRPCMLTVNSSPHVHIGRRRTT